MFYGNAYAATIKNSYLRVQEMKKRIQILTLTMFLVWKDANQQISTAKTSVRAVLIETGISLMRKNIEKTLNLQLKTANIYIFITYVIENDQLKGLICVACH